MVRRNSMNSDVLKLGELLKNYINNKENSTTIAELSDTTNLKGEDIMDALDNIRLDILDINKREDYKQLRDDHADLKSNYDEKSRKYTELEENYEKLEEEYMGVLDGLLENPLFSSIEGLIKIMREAKKRRF